MNKKINNVLCGAIVPITNEQEVKELLKVTAKILHMTVDTDKILCIAKNSLRGNIGAVGLKTEFDMHGFYFMQKYPTSKNELCICRAYVHNFEVEEFSETGDVYLFKSGNYWFV